MLSLSGGQCAYREAVTPLPDLNDLCELFISGV